MKDSGDDRCDNQINELRIACVFPQALVEPGLPEDKQAKDRIDRDKLLPGRNILGGDRIELTVEAQPQRQEVGQIDDNDVVAH